MYEPAMAHPTEIKKEILNEIGISQNQKAEAIVFPGNCIHAIVKARGTSRPTPTCACASSSTCPSYFLRLQNAYDTMEAKAAYRRRSREIKRYDPKRAGVLE
jgi:antitoxin HigA-1